MAVSISPWLLFHKSLGGWRGGQGYITFCPKRRREGGGGRLYQQSRLLKKVQNRAARPLGLKDDSAFLPAAAATTLETQHWGWGGNHSSKILSSLFTEGSTDAENKRRKINVSKSPWVRG